MGLEQAFIAVGSNIDAERNIDAALERLMEATRVESVSTFYRTKAMGNVAQPDFLNGIFEIRTNLGPGALKHDVLRSIEEGLGRVRSANKFIDRTIDLDVVVYGHGTVDEGDLHLPDREIWERPFVAAPLWELAPDLLLGGTGEALRDLESVCARSGLVAEEAFTATLRARLNA